MPVVTRWTFPTEVPLNGGRFVLRVRRDYQRRSDTRRRSTIVWRATIPRRRRIREKATTFDGRNWTDLTTFDPTANFSIKALMGGTTGNHPPVIDSLSDSPDPVSDWRNGHADGEQCPRLGWHRRQRLLLSARATAIHGLQAGTGGDTLICTDTSSDGGWTAAASTAGLAAGTYTYYAQATDNQGALGNVVSTTNTVQADESARPDAVPAQ